jgi:hypothetical protein
VKFRRNTTRIGPAITFTMLPYGQTDGRTDGRTQPKTISPAFAPTATTGDNEDHKCHIYVQPRQILHQAQLVLLNMSIEVGLIFADLRYSQSKSSPIQDLSTCKPFTFHYNALVLLIVADFGCTVSICLWRTPLAPPMHVPMSTVAHIQPQQVHWACLTNNRDRCLGVLHGGNLRHRVLSIQQILVVLRWTYLIIQVKVDAIFY